MKKFISIFIILILLFFTFKMLSESKTIMDTVIYSFNIWTNNLFPSLFPFFIISDLLINYGFIELIAELLKPIFQKVFKLNSNAAFVFIMSMFTGFPSNAKYTRLLYLENKLNENEATKILMFSHFSNPLFILGTISISFLNSKKLGIIVLISHYLSNVIIGILIRNYYPSHENTTFSIKKSINMMHKKRIQNKGFGSIISTAITNSINTLLLILGVVTTFLIITEIITETFNLNLIFKTILSSILEMTQGLKSISILNISNELKALLITAILSFGGLSVHTQIISIISDTKIRYKPFLFARILHVIISVIICYILI